jgi:hypothetical protein
MAGESRELDLRAQRKWIRVISEPTDLPSDQVYRRPDLRRLYDDTVEKLITFELAANEIGEIKQKYRFSMSLQRGLEGSFELELELRRLGAALRGIIRLRPDSNDIAPTTGNDPQLLLKFS